MRFKLLKKLKDNNIDNYIEIMNLDNDILNEIILLDNKILKYAIDYIRNLDNIDDIMFSLYFFNNIDDEMISIFLDNNIFLNIDKLKIINKSKRKCLVCKYLFFKWDNYEDGVKILDKSNDDNCIYVYTILTNSITNQYKVDIICAKIISVINNLDIIRNLSETFINEEAWKFGNPLMYVKYFLDDCYNLYYLKELLTSRNVWVYENINRGILFIKNEKNKVLLDAIVMILSNSYACMNNIALEGVRYLFKARNNLQINLINFLYTNVDCYQNYQLIGVISEFLVNTESEWKVRYLAKCIVNPRFSNLNCIYEVANILNKCNDDNITFIYNYLNTMNEINKDFVLSLTNNMMKL